ncbi:MAG: hypothetical protein ASARMPRED_000295 [Alectoria sarmentosa]|nr:MAG: hypothetical protein ASARMPRED_000295 [Alectoria sarmentosa]
MSSTSRANGATSPKAASNKWQFVNVNEPKKNQDKGIISVVRAHAMRNVRRKQRMELTAQHQKRLKAQAPRSDRADSNATAEYSVQKNPDDWPIGDKADLDWSMSLREMLSKLESTNLGHLASRKEAEVAAEYDQDAQRPDYWQSHSEDETRASKRVTLGTHGPESPKSLVGDGVFDPFDVMPISGCASYNSHALNHFASIIGLNCVPVRQGMGQSTLTKRWLPHALQDSTLFLATLTFAEVHLGILSGNHKSPRALLHKGNSIKAVNAKLRDQKLALSNEAIGAVAMLAAMESILGNYKELRIHMSGLQTMVHMRGGLQSLGWGGVLHMFISWQDLLSSEMIVSAPLDGKRPCCPVFRRSLPYSNPIFPELGLSTELCGEIATSFQDMQYLTQTNKIGEKSRGAFDMLSFCKLRTDVVHRLLSFSNQKLASEMTNLDYDIEICRLAALIYVKVALHMYAPLSAMTQNLKAQLMHLITQGEANSTIDLATRQRPNSITWALFIGGIHSLNNKEEEWFALRLARGFRVSGVETWTEMEERLGQICWLDELNTPTCRSLWRKVEGIQAEYWAHQVRDAASDWDRKGPFTVIITLRRRLTRH